MDVIITGTHHFISLRAACEYYAPYGYSDVKGTVARKIKDGEIVVGAKPVLKSGQKFTWNREGRGVITEVCTKAKAQA
jgi:hypothetical protein